jgi:hypothetical protein
MFINSDFSDLLNLFRDNNVKYLVIGGYAFIQYAEPRLLSGLIEEDFREEGYFYQMGIPPVRVDILMGIPGLNFENVWNRRVEVDFDGLLVAFMKTVQAVYIEKYYPSD